MLDIIVAIVACVLAIFAIGVLIVSNFIDLDELNDGDNEERNTL